MEPQNTNVQFAGVPQSESSPFSQPKSGKGMKVFAIFAVILILGLTTGGVFFFLQNQESQNKIDELKLQLSSTNATLDEFKRATGVDNPNEVSVGGTFDFTNIAEVLGDTAVSLEGAFIRFTKNGNFQIARFGSTPNPIFLYRGDDGQWKKSSFIGQIDAPCSDFSEDEIAALMDFIGCVEEQIE